MFGSGTKQAPLPWTKCVCRQSPVCPAKTTVFLSYLPPFWGFLLPCHLETNLEVPKIITQRRVRFVDFGILQDRVPPSGRQHARAAQLGGKLSWLGCWSGASEHSLFQLLEREAWSKRFTCESILFATCLFWGVILSLGDANIAFKCPRQCGSPPKTRFLQEPCVGAMAKLSSHCQNLLSAVGPCDRKDPRDHAGCNEAFCFFLLLFFRLVWGGGRLLHTVRCSLTC